MQSKHISTEEVLAFLAGAPITGSSSRSFASNFADMPNSVRRAMPEHAPRSIVVAKMEKLIRRGYVGGCGCGCRGDYYIKEKGLEWLARLRPNGPIPEPGSSWNEEELYRSRLALASQGRATVDGVRKQSPLLAAAMDHLVATIIGK